MIEPSILFGDAPCPNCGTLLWFHQGSAGATFFAEQRAELLRQRVRAFLAEHGLSALEDPTQEQLQALGMDSIELVELMMELEAEGGEDS